MPILHVSGRGDSLKLRPPLLRPHNTCHFWEERKFYGSTVQDGILNFIAEPQKKKRKSKMERVVFVLFRFRSCLFCAYFFRMNEFRSVEAIEGGLNAVGQQENSS